MRTPSSKRPVNSYSALILSTLCAITPIAGSAREFSIQVASSRADAVSGGSVLVQLDTPVKSGWTILLNGQDVTQSFRLSDRSAKPIGLLTGLKNGTNTIEVKVHATARATLKIVNHSIAGPIFSGRHQEPFICQTEENGLGPALDTDCQAETVVRYYYKSTEPLQAREQPNEVITARFDVPIRSPMPGRGFKQYDPAATHASDIAKITLPNGRSVNYIVRQEIGVINRAVYEIQFLHQAGEPLPDPWNSRTSGWNGRLAYIFGGGCGSGHRQGVLPSNEETVLPATERDAVQALLAQGYAIATSTLNILGITCDDKISAETASMVKEHFVKRYGEPVHTIGLGGSGGAVSVYLIAQNYPGILDGIIAFLSAPDIITTVIPGFSDCALLSNALKDAIHPWTEFQKTAVSGHSTWLTCESAQNVLSWLGWLDPTKCHTSVPKETIYDATSNPEGIRCTFYDNGVHVYGRRPGSALARRTLDNVGIQYGLIAFNNGIIDADQFIELNERAGGYDDDGKIVSSRTVADVEAIRAAYEHGALLTGKALADIPIIDWNRYLDDLGDFHSRDRALITRMRLIAANGNADNQVVLVTPHPMYDGPFAWNVRAVPGVGLPFLVPAMDRWLGAIAADKGAGTLHAKVVRNRPAELLDGCIAVSGERIFEPADRSESNRCNRMFPLHGNPRSAAGGPLTGDILKCQLKPVDTADYARPLTGSQLDRLNRAFPAGVCDYSKPGVGQHGEHLSWHR